MHSSDQHVEGFLVPIDICYELVGHLRMLWRGFDGSFDVERFALADLVFESVWAGYLVRERPEVAAIAYKYRPPENHPVLGCACHYSAFDPEQAGKSVSGPALKPLPRVQLEQRSGELFAVGLEPS